MSRSIGVYIHVPFCRNKCPYCDFYSLRGSQEDMDHYTEALIRHIRTSPIEAVNSVYFGGGTPTLLGTRRLSQILDAISAHFSLSKNCEVTTEANPRSAEGDTIAALGGLGFTRLSFGMQSAVPEELALLGRRHTRQEIYRSVELGRSGGIDNLSLDIMLGIIDQSPASLSETLSFALALQPRHISAYILKVEKDTPYDTPRFRERIPDEDLQADLYLQTVDTLESHGLCQYEISNFAQPGYESCHNLKYWHCEPYLGLGPGAHSYYNGTRFAYPRNLECFCQMSSFTGSNFVEVTQGGSFFEEFMLGMRLKEGVDLSALSQRHQLDLSPLEKALPFFCQNGLAVLEKGRLHLTPQGFLLSNSIISHLLDTVI